MLKAGHIYQVNVCLLLPGKCFTFMCVSHRNLIKQEAGEPLRASLYAGFFVNGGIMEEGDTWFKHD